MSGTLRVFLSGAVAYQFDFRLFTIVTEGLDS